MVAYNLSSRTVGGGVGGGGGVEGEGGGVVVVEVVVVVVVVGLVLVVVAAAIVVAAAAAVAASPAAVAAAATIMHHLFGLRIFLGARNLRQDNGSFRHTVDIYLPSSTAKARLAGEAEAKTPVPLADLVVIEHTCALSRYCVVCLCSHYRPDWGSDLGCWRRIHPWPQRLRYYALPCFAKGWNTLYCCRLPILAADKHWGDGWRCRSCDPVVLWELCAIWRGQETHCDTLDILYYIVSFFAEYFGMPKLQFHFTLWRRQCQPGLQWRGRVRTVEIMSKYHNNKH